MTGRGILTTALKRSLARINPNGNYEYNLRNININGTNRGCSGFITNKDNGRIVYLDTEPSVLSSLSDKVLVRYATGTKDYTGLRNRHYPAQNNQFLHDILDMLHNENNAVR